MRIADVFLLHCFQVEILLHVQCTDEPRSDVPGRGANGPGLKMEVPGPEHLILWAWAASQLMNFFIVDLSFTDHGTNLRKNKNTSPLTNLNV